MRIMKNIMSICMLAILLLSTFGTVGGTELAGTHEGKSSDGGENSGETRSTTPVVSKTSRSTRATLTEPCMSSVQVIDGVPRLVVDGDLVPITGYYGCVDPCTNDTNFDRYTKHINYTASGDLNIINLDLWWGALDKDYIWTPPASPADAAARLNWTRIDAIMDYAASKGVYVIILFRWQPPVWWYAMNNAYNYYYCTQINHTAFVELSGLINGSVLMPSFNAPNLVIYADEVVKALTNRYKNHPALLGWKLGHGFTTENNYPGGGYYDANGWFDYSLYMMDEFRKWLRIRYNNDLVALRNAWQNSTVTFDNAMPPQPPPDNEAIDNIILNGPGDLRRAWLDWQMFRLEIKKQERDHFAALFKQYDPNHVVVGVSGSPLPCGWGIFGCANELVVDYYDYVTNPNIDGVLVCPHIDDFESVIHTIPVLFKYFQSHGMFVYIKLEKWKDPVPHNSIESILYFFTAMGAGILWDMGGIPASGEKLAPGDYPEFSSEYTEPERAIINRSWYLTQTVPHFAPRKEKFAFIDPAPLYVVDNQESGYTDDIYWFSAYKGMDLLYTVLMFESAGLEFDVIHADEIVTNPELLNDYKAVALVNIFRMNETLVDVLVNYRSSGGGLFITGRTGIYDEYGNPDFTKLQKLLGITNPINEYKVNIKNPQDTTWSFVFSDSSGLINGIEGKTPENYNFYHIPTFDYESAGYTVIGHLRAKPEIATVGYKNRCVFWFSRLGWGKEYRILCTDEQFNITCQFLRSLYDFYDINHDETGRFEVESLGGWYKFLRTEEPYSGDISFDLTSLQDYDPSAEYVIYNWSNMTPIAKLAPTDGKLTTKINLKGTTPYLFSITECTPTPSFVAAEWAIYNDTSWKPTRELFILNVTTKENCEAKVSVYLAGKDHDGYTIQIKNGELLGSQKDDATDTLLIDFIPHTNSTSINISFDKTPPSISNIRPTPETPTDLDNVIITADISDVNDIKQANLLYNNGSGWINSTMIKNMVWEGTIPKQEAETEVQYKIYARDIIGNWNVSKIYNYTVVPWDLVDLSIFDVTIEPERLVNGTQATINVTIYNDEGLNADNVIVEFIVDGVAIENKTASVLANTTTITSFNWVAIAGTHTLTIKVDPKNSIRELDETNNNFTIEIKMYTLPDLTLSPKNITIEPESLTEGDIVYINASIYLINLTTEGLTLPIEIDAELRVDDIYQETKAASINGEVTVISFNWTAIKGEHNITVIVDVKNVIKEANEDNNIATKMIVVMERMEKREEDSQPVSLWIYVTPLIIVLILIIIIFLLLRKRKRK